MSVFKINLVARLCTRSSAVIFSLVGGHQTCEVYSVASCDRASDLYKTINVFWSHSLVQVLLIMPNVLLTLQMMMSMWLFQDNLVETCTPRCIRTNEKFDAAAILSFSFLSSIYSDIHYCQGTYQYSVATFWERHKQHILSIFSGY